ncbi:LysR family transcriptional regulator [Thermoactinomyces sp. CICC 24226]|nr:LysR family transcriptional regulator [Thermoactinomyces sp. CICC 24226]
MNYLIKFKQVCIANKQNAFFFLQIGYSCNNRAGRHLEQDLDVVLFHRTSAGIELTEAGERFYNRIVPVLDELNAVRQELRRFCQTTPVAIGSLPSLAIYYLPPRIRGNRFSGRSMTLMIQNTFWELIQSLQEGRLDAVFVDTSYVGDSLWSCELFTESYYAVFPLHHRFRERKTVHLSELCDKPLIVHQAPCDTRKHIIEQMELLGRKPNIISEVAFGDFILGAVAAGMGITIIPELMAKNIGHLQLFALPVTDFGRERSISIAARHRKLGRQLYQLISTAK